MKNLMVIMMIFTCVGCSVTTGSPDRIIVDSDGSVTIESNHQYSSKGHGKDYHCPPGQAKKGKC